MYCNHCGSPVLENAAVCVNCGVAVEGQGGPVTSAAVSRSSYILLGVLLGLIGFPGIHNFYAGNQSRGLTQLLVTVLSCWILWLPIYIWTIVEACTVTVDAQGRPMS